MLDADELLREALALPAEKRRHLARELLKSVGGAKRSRVPPHPAIPDEGLLLRRSLIACAVVKLRIGDEDCLLLAHHRVVGDWTFPCGRVEANDVDSSTAANREAAKGLAPLRAGEDFEIAREPFARPEYGPVLSETAWGVALVFQAAFYSLQFKRDPRTCLARLTPGEFRFAAISELMRGGDGVKLVRMLQYELADGWSSVPFSWSEALEVDPLRR